MRKVLIVVISFLLFFSLLSTAHAQNNDVLVLEIEGPVTAAMTTYFERGIARAEAEGATAVLIVLNTPGGNITPMLDIVEAFRNAEVPVIVYISPRGAQAASAGSIISFAAHVAAMAPETTIGAASPVGDGGAELEETIFRKITEDMKATVRSLTERRGEEVVSLAESMIDDAVAVNAEEALAVGAIDVIAEDIPDLLVQIDGLVVQVGEEQIQLQTAVATQRPFEMTLVELLLQLVANPILISVLFTIGVQAIIIEISNPGGWAAGFVGVLLIGLGLYGAGQLPVNWLGFGLIALAFILFGIEVATINNGALAVTGTITFFAGLLVLFNSPGAPDFARISIPVAILISLGAASLFIFLATMVLRAHRSQPRTGAEGLVGKFGPVRTPITSKTDKPPYRGMVLVMGELWHAEADEPIDKNSEVEVIRMDGLTVHVKKVAEPA